ncbi:MAG: hypothetical protein KAX38_09715 [Candidatus Krumholzibacteria bacterium]|nr:hypothetical protein [Candidatus Krumholzibacteria bacterium]
MWSNKIRTSGYCTTTEHELFETCKRINDLASKFDDKELDNVSFIEIEALIEREIVVMHRFLFLLTRAALMESAGLLIFGAGSKTVGNIEDEALETIVPLFLRRNSSKRYEIVHVVRNLFRKNPEAESKDTLKYMIGTVKRTISNKCREKLREKNPLFISTSRKVKDYIDNSERFECCSGIVRESHKEPELEDRRFQNTEELVSMCGSVSPVPSTVSEAVEIIFDSLKSDMLEVRRSVRLKDLKSAVCRILEPIIIYRQQNRKPMSPYLDFLLNESYKLLCETSEELRISYQWRKGFDEITRTAFCEAGIEYIWDKTRFDKQLSQFKYLAAYIPGCAKHVYNREYKGSLQNFFKTLEEQWRNKLRADE